MTKTKKQLRAEAVERLKNCVAARFDAESIVIALTSGRHGQSDWSLECDKLIDLLTDDANDDLTPEKVVSGSEPCVTPESCRQYADQRKQAVDADRESCDSREQLEVDIRKYANPEGNTGTLGACWERKMLEFIDRQAAITERECRKPNWSYCETCEALEKLTAEREQYRKLFGMALDWAHEITMLESSINEGIA